MYNLSNPKETFIMATKKLDKNSKDIFYKDYCNVVKTAQQLLKDNTEWQARYASYLRDIIALKSELSLRCCKGLYYYTTISDIQDSTEDRLNIQIRYKGQYVGKILQKQNDLGLYTHQLIIDSKTAETNYKTFSKYKDESALTNDNGTPKKVVCDWHSSREANAFRKFFYTSPEKGCNNKGQEEHREHILESAFLSEIEKEKATDKLIRNIQPIKLHRLRFQFPTVFTGSSLRKDPINAKILKNLIYCKPGDGGGIDILARRKKGPSYLTVIELKETNKLKPEIAIRQAIAYATFIRELIRYDAEQNINNTTWYSEFGFNPNSLNKDLIIKCVIAMPGVSDPNLFKNAELTEIPLPDNTGKHKDKLLLHCINIDLKDGDRNNIINLIADKDF